MAPKSAALKGRKSGVAPRSNATVTDSAARSKRTRAASVSASDDENVDTSKSKRAAAATDGSGEESDDGDVEASLVPASASPAKKAKTASKKSKSTSSTGVTDETEDSSAKEGNADETMVLKDLPKRSKIQAKDTQGRKVRKYTATTESGSPGDDDSDDEVASSASNGQRGTYHWDLEVPQFHAKDVGTKLTNHDTIKVKLHRDGEDMKFAFFRGQKLFILPDPSTLPPSSKMIEIEQLPDDLFWVAQIVDLVKFDQSEQAPGHPPLGLFRVQWMYSGDHALDLINKGHLHPSYRNRIAKYRFAEDERIASDHTDFVSIQAFAGFADGIDTFLRLEGLYVSDEDRLKPEKKRSPRTKDVVMVGWAKKAAEMARYDRKERLTKKAPDSAASASKSRTKKVKKPASSSQTKTAAKKAKKPSSSQAKAKKTSTATKKTSTKKSKKAAVLEE